MRKTVKFGGLILMIPLVTGCSVMSSGKKTLHKAVDESIDLNKELYEASETYHGGTVERGKDGTGMADKVNKFQTKYICDSYRKTVKPDVAKKVISNSKPSELDDKEERKEMKKQSKKAFKKTKKEKGSDKKDAYVTSKEKDFKKVFGTSKIHMIKEDGKWKVCDSAFGLNL